jgi:hypothetical protein
VLVADFEPFTALDTVDTETPAAAATSWMVGRRDMDRTLRPGKRISKTFDEDLSATETGSTGPRHDEATTR